MRNRCTGAIAGVAGVLFLSALAVAQSSQSNAPRSPWRYYPMDRATGDGGPAPKRDLSGTWAGPSSGSGAPRQKGEIVPPLTPMGQQLFARNKPMGKFSPGGTNDPHSRYCDPFGFPQNMTQEIRGMTITTLSNRTFLLLQYMDLWREIWTDGRALPAAVGGRSKVRFGNVVIVIPRISWVMFCGTPNGSQYRECGSFVPPGLYLPIGLARSYNCLPSGVSGAGTSFFCLGAPAPDDGPAHVPVRSRFGAGPPSPVALSIG